MQKIHKFLSINAHKRYSVVKSDKMNQLGTFKWFLPSPCPFTLPHIKTPLQAIVLTLLLQLLQNFEVFSMKRNAYQALRQFQMKDCDHSLHYKEEEEDSNKIPFWARCSDSGAPVVLSVPRHDENFPGGCSNSISKDYVVFASNM